MTEQTLQKSDLRHFSGTNVWHRHWLSKTALYTEGVQYVIDMGRACWLVNEIVLAQPNLPASASVFQLWILTVSEDGKGVLRCLNGDREEVYRNECAYTDFPLDEIKFYFMNNVLMLPSEY